MILLLADTCADAERLRQAVDGAAIVVGDASELVTADDRTECMIIGCRSRFLRNRIGLLKEIGRKLPLTPVILVTDRETGVTRLLSRPGVRKLRKLALVSFVVLAAACGDTIEIPFVPKSCGDLFVVVPVDPFVLRVPIVLSIGGSRRLRVRLVNVAREHYSHCPEVSLDGFRWTIHDPSVARVKEEGEGAATITGLAAGATRIEVRFESSGVGTDVWQTLLLDVVEDGV